MAQALNAEWPQPSPLTQVRAAAMKPQTTPGISSCSLVCWGSFVNYVPDRKSEWRGFSPWKASTKAVFFLSLNTLKDFAGKATLQFD